MDPKSLDAGALSSYVSTAQQVKSQTTVDFLMKLIPTTFVNAFAGGDVLQVLLISIGFGCALALLGQPGKPLLAFIEQASHVFFKMMFFVVKLAPLGVLGAIAFTVGKYGIGSLKQLGYLVALFYLTVGIFILVVLGGIMRIAGFNILKFIRYLREELMIVLGTASSDSVLPQIMRKLERMGINRLLVQPGRLLDLSHARRGIHRSSDEHTVVNVGLADDSGDRLDHVEGRARRAGFGDRHSRGDSSRDPGNPRYRARDGVIS